MCQGSTLERRGLPIARLAAREVGRVLPLKQRYQGKSPSTSEEAVVPRTYAAADHRSSQAVVPPLPVYYESAARQITEAVSLLLNDGTNSTVSGRLPVEQINGFETSSYLEVILEIVCVSAGIVYGRIWRGPRGKTMDPTKLVRYRWATLGAIGWGLIILVRIATHTYR
jgi:hypothetical protein